MSKGDLRAVVLVSVLVIITLYVQTSCGQGGHGGQGGNRRAGRRINGARRGGMNPEIHRAYVQLLQGRSMTTTSTPTPTAVHPFQYMIPSLPAPHEIECYVEVVRIERRGGICTRAMGNASNPYICQSGEQIEMHAPCRGIMAARGIPPIDEN